MDYFSWDGVNWREVREGKITVPGAAFELPKRDRPQTLNEAQFLNPAKLVTVRKLPRPPKQHITHDFQFFPQRLQELLNKERDAYLAKRADVEVNEPEKPDYGELTAEEEAEKEQLLGAGFVTWSRRDYQAFVRGCEKFGRNSFDKIAGEVGGGKTVAEIREYAGAFWQRWTELRDGERAVKAVERGELANKRQNRYAEALAKKVAQYKDPWKQLRIVFRGGRHQDTLFTDAEDTFLVCAMHQEGIGSWDRIRELAFAAPSMRFDWFQRSRTTGDVAQRCQLLLRVVEREVNGDAEDAAPKPKRRKKPAAKKEEQPQPPLKKPKEEEEEEEEEEEMVIAPQP
jgi:SWI/SNF-related matrix-associated actin-dependent regulator of chromatin subfamily A member 5